MTGASWVGSCGRILGRSVAGDLGLPPLEQLCFLRLEVLFLRFLGLRDEAVLQDECMAVGLAVAPGKCVIQIP